MKKNKNMKFILKMIIALIVGVIIIPILIDHLIIGNQLYSNISNSEWISFLGSYLGGILSGILAVVGVFYTIGYYKKQEKRNVAANVKPILNIWQLNGSLRNIDEYFKSVRHFDYVLHDGYFKKWIGFESKVRAFDKNDWVHVDIVIENVGNGAVMQLKTQLKTANELKGFAEQTINIQKDSSVIYRIFIEKKELSTQNKNELVFQYTDIYNSQCFEQILEFWLMPNTKAFADMGEISLPQIIK